MADMLSYFIGKIGPFFSWLNSLSIVDGVTLMTFFGAMMLIIVLIRSLLLRAR